MTNTAERITVPVVQPVEDSNIIRQYAIQKASWLWHPDFAVDEDAMLIFRNDITLGKEEETIIHISADMRYELYLDDALISSGPDRGDLWHWGFSSYKVKFSAGEHRLSAIVWWIGDKAPMAQITHRGGFIMAAEGELEDKIDTGRAPWRVGASLGWSYDRKFADRCYHVVGPAWEVDGRKLYGHPRVEVDPVEVQGPLISNDTGIVRNGWHLFPAAMPDQRNVVIAPGRIRAVAERDDLGLIADADIDNPAVEKWQGMLEGGAVTVPEHTTCYVIWDLEDYYCGYEQVLCSGGRDSDISLEWAESMFENKTMENKSFPGERHRVKGNRNEVNKKYFLGFGLHVTTDGGDNRIYCAPWWHSGRYLMLRVRTAEEPLVMKRMALRETRYPMENEGNFISSDTGLQSIIPMAVRGIQMCSHETLTDCPYYEQMMYVGDTRLQMLVTGVMTSDDRLLKRGMELFDWSRWKTGVVAERYPARQYQISYTFACVWALMLHDYSLWHDDVAWLRERMTGLRSQLIHFTAKKNADGLLAGLPGWSFVDWASGWVNGRPPVVVDGRPSCVVNLQYAYALRAAADLEEQCGDPDLSKLYYRDADACCEAVRKTFWQEDRKLFSDDPDGKYYSEHAQCLALVVGVWNDNPVNRQACFDAMLAADDLVKTTIYFSYYLFECYYLFKRGDLMQERLEYWKTLVANGFKTPIESPDPARSDCHAWGSHPLWHMHCSLAGVRPGSPGYKSVRISPQPGTLKHIAAETPHPRGIIVTDMTFRDGGCNAKVTLPEGTGGVFIWKGTEQKLNAGGTTEINL